MNKRSIAKKFNEAEIGQWSDIMTEKIKLTNASFTESEESKQEINAHFAKYYDTFFTKAILKKVIGSKTIVVWPTDGTPFKPVVDRVEVFRVSASKYIMLIRVSHLG